MWSSVHCCFYSYTHFYVSLGFSSFLLGFLDDVPWKSDRNFVSDVSIKALSSLCCNSCRNCNSCLIYVRTLQSQGKACNSHDESKFNNSKTGSTATMLLFTAWHPPASARKCEPTHTDSPYRPSNASCWFLDERWSLQREAGYLHIQCKQRKRPRYGLLC